MSGFARKLVSKQKRRFVDEEHKLDLDLSYVTDRIIGLGFPSEGVQKSYRNPIKEVVRFFQCFHDSRYLLFNLCSEEDRRYNPQLFHKVSMEYQWPDHQAPPFLTVVRLCAVAKQFLDADAQHVVALHCKAGKGRTGTAASCLLLATGVVRTADDALHVYGQRRTHNGKGVTIASQKRTVHYYERYLEGAVTLAALEAPEERVLRVMRLHGQPNFDSTGGCDPYCNVYVWSHKDRCFQFHFKTQVVKFKSWKGQGYVDVQFAGCPPVRGDVKLDVLDWDRLSADDKMFSVTVHTAFVHDAGAADGPILFRKHELDGVAQHDKKEEHFANDFAVELCFGSATPHEPLTVVPKEGVVEMDDLLESDDEDDG